MISLSKADQKIDGDFASSNHMGATLTSCTGRLRCRGILANAFRIGEDTR